MTALSDEALWLIAAKRPGLAWQALRPDTRPLLDIVRNASDDSRDAFYAKRQGIVSPWAALPTTTQQLITEILQMGPNPGIDAIEVVPLTWLRPWPATFIESRYIAGDERLSSGSFGFPEGPTDRSMRTEVREWLNAGSHFECWSTQLAGPLTFHFSPTVVANDRDLVIRTVSEAAESNRQYLGLDTIVEGLEVYVYGVDDTEAFPTITGGTHYAHPHARQVHQTPDATPGHEVMHVLAFDAWGPPASAAASEGLALYRSGSFQHHYAPQIALLERNCRTWTFDEFGYSTRDYLLAGAWMAFLDARIGVRAVHELYSSTEPQNTIRRLLGDSVIDDFCLYIGAL